MKKSLDPTTLFNAAQLAALDAWIAEQNGYADPDSQSDRADFGYGLTDDGTAVFEALDGQLDTHYFDAEDGTFKSTADIEDPDHPLLDVDVMPIPGAPRRF